MTRWLSTPELFAEISDLVCETNLDGMERIASILDHFRFADAGPLHRGGQSAIDSATWSPDRVVARTDHGKRRVSEIAHGGCLAHELWIHADAEVAAAALARALLKCWNDRLLDSAGKDSAANVDDNVMLGCLKEFADVSQHAKDLLQSEAAVVVAGCANANQSDIAEKIDPATSPQAAGLHPGSNDSVQSRLDYRAASSIEEIYLGVSKINAGDLMTVLRKAGRCHTTDVTETENSYFHRCLKAESLLPKEAASRSEASGT